MHDTYILVVQPAQAGNAVLGKIQGVLSSYGAALTCPVASALPAGHRIGPGSKFGMYSRMVWVVYDGGGASCPTFRLRVRIWGNAQGRFLGLEFTVQGQKHFGWARFNVTSSVAVTLTGYAYETEPNKPIRAGDTGPVAAIRVPEMYSAPRGRCHVATGHPRPAGAGVSRAGHLAEGTVIDDCRLPIEDVAQGSPLALRLFHFL